MERQTEHSGIIAKKRILTHLLVYKLLCSLDILLSSDHFILTTCFFHYPVTMFTFLVSVILAISIPYFYICLIF